MVKDISRAKLDHHIAVVLSRDNENTSWSWETTTIAGDLPTSDDQITNTNAGETALRCRFTVFTWSPATWGGGDGHLQSSPQIRVFGLYNTGCGSNASRCDSDFWHSSWLVLVQLLVYRMLKSRSNRARLLAIKVKYFSQSQSSWFIVLNSCCNFSHSAFPLRHRNCSISDAYVAACDSAGTGVISPIRWAN